MADREVVRNYLRELVMASFEKRSPYMMPEGITLDDITEMAQKGQMQCLLLGPLINICEDGDNKEKLKKLIRYSLHRAFLQGMESKTISDALEKAGVKHQLLKGSVLRWFYSEPQYREMSDIDIIIYEESLDEAAKVIEKLGFKNKGLVKHHMIFEKEGGVSVEAHWSLFDKNVDNFQFLYYKDNFRAGLVKGKQYTYEFSKEDFYVYMISHMAKHFFETGCGIRNLLDIYIYITKFGKEMDMDYIAGELQKCGIFDFEEKMRKMSFIWMDMEECPDFYENLFAYMLDSGIYGKGENGVWSQLAKETFSGNSNLKLHYYFPSINFMREKYPWLEKAPILLPVAWVMRGICAVASKESRKHKEEFLSAGEEKTKVMLDIYHNLKLDFRR